MSKQEIVAVARSWIGTPYQHQHSVRGRGADCLGLLRGIWREVLGAEPEIPPRYSADWSEASGEERLWHAAIRHLRPIADPEPGDVLLFRMRTGAVAKHLGILAGSRPDYRTIIHAYSGRGVVETPLDRPWARRVVASFEFPLGG